MKSPACRFCSTPLTHTFVDLGISPLSNSYLRPEDLGRMEPFYPLHARVCDECWLVQLEEFESPQAIFSDYAYFSSCSDSWLEHVKAYAAMMIDRFGLDTSRRVVEVASNDGYLLRWFREAGMVVLGIEPAVNVAQTAEAADIPTLVRFFGTKAALELVADGIRADLLVGNNVLAHVPDINDFVAGMKILLAEDGIITMEFPHILRLMEGNQFDTIYHEHFSYLSFITTRRIFSAHGLAIFDVDEIPTHGGSLRIYARHAEINSEPISMHVQRLMDHETGAGLADIQTYGSFSERVQETKRRLLEFLIQAKREGKAIVGYGAPAKGNTLLNYCGIRTDFIDYTVDRSPHKQGKFLPGTHIPIHHPDKVRETKPDYLLILPWNLGEEIMEQMKHVREWGCRFVIPIPSVEVVL